MLIKSGVCEMAILCTKCSRYHAPNIDCTRVHTAIEIDGHAQVHEESINKNESGDTSIGVKGVTNA